MFNHKRVCSPDCVSFFEYYYPDGHGNIVFTYRCDKANTELSSYRHSIFYYTDKGDEKILVLPLRKGIDAVW